MTNLQSWLQDDTGCQTLGESFREMEIDFARVVMGPKVGAGASGQVFRARYGAVEIAVKHAYGLGVSIQHDEAQLSEFSDEAALWRVAAQWPLRCVQPPLPSRDGVALLGAGVDAAAARPSQHSAFLRHRQGMRPLCCGSFPLAVSRPRLQMPDPVSGCLVLALVTEYCKMSLAALLEQHTALTQHALPVRRFVTEIAEVAE